MEESIIDSLMHSTTIIDRHLSGQHTERPGRMESVWVVADMGFFRHLVEQQLGGASDNPVEHDYEPEGVRKRLSQRHMAVKS